MVARCGVLLQSCKKAPINLQFCHYPLPSRPLYCWLSQKIEESCWGWDPVSLIIIIHHIYPAQMFSWGRVLSRRQKVVSVLRTVKELALWERTRALQLTNATLLMACVHPWVHSDYASIHGPCRIVLGSPKATELAERSLVRHLSFRTSSIAKRSSGI